MSTANNCAILTILPLGVTCSVTGTTSPLTTDGAVEITITGGTEPYFIQWLDSNNQPLGISSTFRNNLDVGNYKSIVTDVYGDFSATTICEVSPDSIFVEQFTNCYDFTLLYVSGNTPTTLFTQNKVYTLLGYTGCWEKTNRFLNTSALPYVLTTRLSGPYNYCSDCLPAAVVPISPSMTPTNTPTPTITPTITPTPTLTPSITPSITPSSDPYPYFLAGYCYGGRMYAVGGSPSSNCTQVQSGLGSATRYKSNYPYSYLYSGLWSTVNMFIYDTVTGSLLNSKPIADGCQYWETSSLGKVLVGYPQVGYDCTTPGGCCPGIPPAPGL